MRGVALHFDIGTRFGRLVIRAKAERATSGRLWLCRCDCGAESKVRGTDLMSGHTTSCGCFVVERTIEASTTHGHASRGEHSLTYVSYALMRQRCLNPNAGQWSYYGGRGIKICERWLESFDNFLADMGEREEGMSIERVDPHGDYEPSNCVWATKKEQANNRTNARRVEFGNVTMTIAELSDRVGVPYDVLYKRIVYRKMPVADAVAKSCRRRFTPPRPAATP